MLILMCLTTWTLTRLIVTDTLPFVRVPRDAITAWLDPRDETNRPIQRVGKDGKPQEPALGVVGRWLAYLLTCPRCMSAWVGGAVVIATDHWYSVPAPWLVWGGAWAVASWLANLEMWAEERWRLTRNRRWQVRKEMGLPYLDESEQ
jgi:hypothetical protein